MSLHCTRFAFIGHWEQDTFKLDSFKIDKVEIIQQQNKHKLPKNLKRFLALLIVFKCRLKHCVSCIYLMSTMEEHKSAYANFGSLKCYVISVGYCYQIFNMNISVDQGYQ